METQQQEQQQEGEGKKKKGRGKGKSRTDGGQPAVIKMEALVTKVDYLTDLLRAAENAKTDFAEAVKQVAENAGLHAKNVRSFIIARAGEKFQQKKEQVGQLSLIFEEGVKA